MAILLLFLATLLAPTAQAQGSRPNVPDAFTGNGTMIVFGFGTPTVMYFDYAGQRQRFDQQAFGGVQTIVEYHTEGIKYTVFQGTCTRDQIAGKLSPYTLPSWATLVSSSGTVEQWHFDIFGVISNDVWVNVSMDGKSDSLQKVVTTTYGFTVSINFDDIVNSVDDAVFDPKSFGCPPLVPPPTFTISGFVNSAVTNGPIASASVTLGGSVGTITDSQGMYSFADLPAGNYSIAASAAGFSNASLQIALASANVPAGTIADFSLSPVLPAGGYRIVVRWGSQPSDLDSHLIYSAADGQCEVRVCVGLRREPCP